MAVNTPDTELGLPMPRFSLPDPGGALHDRDAVMGPNGLVVAFICNHCPYVIAVADRIARTARDLAAEGVGFVGIMSNDWQAYPQDAPDRMVGFADRYGFTFPYLVDETQEIARSYGAVCTPDFFGLDRDGVLRYRGRLDESGRSAGPVDADRDLFDAMRSVARGEAVPADQQASMGCSIKWRG